MASYFPTLLSASKLSRRLYQAAPYVHCVTPVVLETPVSDTFAVAVIETVPTAVSDTTSTALAVAPEPSATLTLPTAVVEAIPLGDAVTPCVVVGDPTAPLDDTPVTSTTNQPLHLHHRQTRLTKLQLA